MGEDQYHFFWMVLKRQVATNLPSEALRRYATEEAAMQRADQLSRKFPDAKFYVLQTVAKFQAGERENYPVPNR